MKAKLLGVSLIACVLMMVARPAPAMAKDSQSTVSVMTCATIAPQAVLESFVIEANSFFVMPAVEGINGYIDTTIKVDLRWRPIKEIKRQDVILPILKHPSSRS